MLVVVVEHTKFVLAVRLGCVSSPNLTQRDSLLKNEGEASMYVRPCTYVHCLTSVGHCASSNQSLSVRARMREIAFYSLKNQRELQLFSYVSEVFSVQLKMRMILRQ